MPLLKIQVSDLRDQLIKAAVQHSGRPIEDLMEGYFRDLEVSMGLDHGDTPEDQAASATKALRKAAKVDASRKAAADAVAKTASDRAQALVDAAKADAVETVL